jgi:hypothetical protein
MSGDIVKKLRVPPDLMTDFGRVGLLGEAATEIERLRARVEVLEGLLSPLSAEADRYDPPEGDDDHLAWGSVLRIGHLRKTRAALEAKP